jgi:DNA-binding CsgD family transcriptional regulator
MRSLNPEAIAKEFPSLSAREAQLCSLVVLRLSTSEIAAHLSISRRTVEKHLENVFVKLGVQSREQLRLRLGVLPPIGVPREK